MPHRPQSPFGRAHPSKEASGLEILLVEDSTEEAAAFERALRRDSARTYVLRRAGSLAEAHRVLEARTPDLVFVDFWLPDGIGIELVEQNKANAENGAAFVLLTEGDDETLTSRALRAGVQDYLLKARLSTTTLWQTIDFARERRRIHRELAAQRDELDRQNQELIRRQQELQRLNERLQELASTDGLTGLKNHRAFQERLRQEVAVSRRHGLSMAIVLLDVDHFKQLNDEHGHPAGDTALERLADVIRNNARAGDFLARYGGEEFALILPSTDLSGAEAVAEKLRAAIAVEPFDFGPVTASFGCAELSPLDEGASSLLARTDEALYAAKSAGRNAVRSASAWNEATNVVFPA